MHLLQYAPHSQRPSRQWLLSWRLSAGRGSSWLGPRGTQPGPPPAKRQAPTAPPSDGSGAGPPCLQLQAGDAASNGNAIRAPLPARPPQAASSLSVTRPPLLARPLPAGRSGRPSLTRSANSSAASSGSGVGSLPWGTGLASQGLQGRTSLLPTPPPGNTPQPPSRAAERQWHSAVEQRTQGQPHLPLLASKEQTWSSGSQAGLILDPALQHAVAAGGALTRSRAGMPGGLAAMAEAQATTRGRAQMTLPGDTLACAHGNT